jgi:hypothetical protein
VRGKKVVIQGGGGDVRNRARGRRGSFGGSVTG